MKSMVSALLIALLSTEVSAADEAFIHPGLMLAGPTWRS
jgi:hypothetical protein